MITLRGGQDKYLYPSGGEFFDPCDISYEDFAIESIDIHMDFSRCTEFKFAEVVRAKYIVIDTADTIQSKKDFLERLDFLLSGTADTIQSKKDFLERLDFLLKD